MLINYLNKLQHLAQCDKLPHAILLFGANKLPFELAIRFAAWLLTQNNNIDLANHPDYLLINLPVYQEITIEIIRNINIFANSNAYLGERKVVILNNFQNINKQAANAFLKTLEEPLSAINIVFLLISNNNIALPATILSRTIQINFTTINNHANSVADRYNILQDLYDIWILEKNNYSQVLEKWYSYDKHELLSCLWFTLTNVLKANKDIKLLQIKQKISQNMLWALLDGLNYMNKAIILQHAINWQLFLDNFVFIKIIKEHTYGK